MLTRKKIIKKHRTLSIYMMNKAILYLCIDETAKRETSDFLTKVCNPSHPHTTCQCLLKLKFLTRD